MTLSILQCEPAHARHESPEVVEAPEQSDWNAYVDRAGARAFFHRTNWEDVFNVYGLSMLRLAAVRQQRVRGILSLVRQRSRIFGDRFVSLPWFDAAGVIADSDDDRRFLIEAAVQRAETLGIDRVELRHAEPIKLSPFVRTDKVLMRLELPPRPERLWSELNAKVRNQVRKSEKSGLTVEIGGGNLLPEFFDVYSHNMRDLGSPSHECRFFATVLRAFPHQARVHVIRRQGRAVGAGLTFIVGDTIEIPWASSLRAHNDCCVNHALYWHLLRTGCEEGRRWFHFGRSTRHSGSYHFKRHWGAEEVQLYWYYLGRNAEAGTTPNSETYHWAAAAWRRLPIWVTRRLGPRVIAKVS